MSETESLDIELLGKHFTVAVKPGERESLEVAVALVAEKLQKLASKTTRGGETLVVMAALDIAHEFVSSQRGAGLDIPGYRRKISAMTERVEEAMARQEKLF